MSEFDLSWEETGGQRFLYVRPQSAVSDDDWVNLLQAELPPGQHEVFLLLVDLVGVEDNIGIDGFTRLADLFQKHIRRTRIAVLPSIIPFWWTCLSGSPKNGASTSISSCFPNGRQRRHGSPVGGSSASR